YASLVFASATALLLGACGSADSTTERVGQESAAIIHGGVDTTVHDSVVYIFIELPGGYGAACTGTLIAENVVVTARHCVSEIDESVNPPTVGKDYTASTV